MKTILNRKIQRLKGFYRLYTTGLSRTEVERLLKKDTVEALSYYRDKTDLKGTLTSAGSVTTVLRGFREIFISFLMRLTPARRLFYGLSCVVFAGGLLTMNNLWVLGAFIVLNLLLALELADKLTTRDELEIAREIQKSLEPEDLPEFAWLSVSCASKPAKIVGGDFFNVVKCGADRMLSIVGDVAGKGIPAALYAAHIQSMFESLSEQRTSPADILTGLNQLICRRLREGDFITAVIAVFDGSDRTVTIARAGHNWPLHYSARTGKITPLKTRGVCIGVDRNGGFSACLEEKALHLHNGDVLLLYSDGVTEAMDPASRLFDLSRLEAALAESADRSAEDILQCIDDRLAAFIRTEEPHDDITMVAVKVL